MLEFLPGTLAAEYDKKFSKGNRRQHVSGHFSEPVGAFAVVAFAYLKVSQQQGLRLFHRRYRLPSYAHFEKAKELLVRLVEVGDQHSNRSLPVGACHEGLESDPRGKSHGGSHTVSVGNNSWMAELQVSESDPPSRQLTVEPVQIIMLAATHPSRRFFNISDVEGLL